MTLPRLPRPQDLLPGAHPPAPGAAATELVTGRRVLVTGAAGSVGAALVRRLTALGPRSVHLLDVDEGRLHALQLELTGHGFTDATPVLLTDVRDARALDAAFAEARPDVVLHAAALKHVALLERFPCAGVTTNVWGTENVARVAARHGVRRLVNVSTDKAADPVSVLGATKRLAEVVVRDAGVPAASVRFGNVLGSRGSFWDVLVHQLGAGLPVTVTDPDATRYLMTIDEAAALVVEAAALAHDGGTYVLDMGEPVRVLDLVHRFAALAGLPRPEVRVTGLLAGEKQHETLVGAGEHTRPTDVPRVRLCPPAPRPHRLASTLGELYAAADESDVARVRSLLGHQFAGLRAAADDRDPRHGPRHDAGCEPSTTGPGAPAGRPALRVLGPVPA